MFVTIKHGADRDNLFNPDCCMVNFMDSIRKCCEISEEKIVDLTDEKGLVIDLLSKDDTDRAANYLNHCETYVLVEKVPVTLGLSRGAKNQHIDSDYVFEAEMRQRRSRNVRKIKTNFQYQYLPLLTSVSETYPDYFIHTEVVETKAPSRRANSVTKQGRVVVQNGRTVGKTSTKKSSS